MSGRGGKRRAHLTTPRHECRSHPYYITLRYRTITHTPSRAARHYLLYPGLPRAVAEVRVAGSVVLSQRNRFLAAASFLRFVLRLCQLIVPCGDTGPAFRPVF